MRFPIQGLKLPTTGSCLLAVARSRPNCSTRCGAPAGACWQFCSGGVLPPQLQVTPAQLSAQGSLWGVQPSR